MELFWLDPQPIDDTDYRVTHFQKKPESDFALIQYNEGDSEAEVPMDELVFVEPVYAENTDDDYFQIYYFKDTGDRVPHETLVAHELGDELFLMPNITMDGG